MKTLNKLKATFPTLNEIKILALMLVVILPFLAVVSLIPVVVTAAVLKFQFWFVYCVCLAGIEILVFFMGVVGLWIVNIIFMWNKI